MRGFLSKMVAVTLTALLIGAGSPLVSENITANTTPVAGLYLVPDGDTVRILPSASNDIRVRLSREYLKDSDFENVSNQGSVDNDQAFLPITPTSSGVDAWDDSNNLQAPWSFTESGPITHELETTIGTFIRGNASLRFEASATTALVGNTTVNGDMENVTGDDFALWTENVNAGSGTVTSDEAVVKGGAEAARLTGGSAHVDFSNTTAITVTASTSYVLTVWGQIGAAGDLLDIRVREATGGTDFLQADGTWAAGEVDFCNASFTTGTMQACIIEFTTDTGITGLTIWAAVDVSGDIGTVDNWALAAAPEGTNVRQGTLMRLTNTTADTYMLQFQHRENDFHTFLEFSLRKNVATPTSTEWYTGSAWSTTETWLNVTNSTSNTTVQQTFEADTGDANGAPILVTFRVRAAATDGDAWLDSVALVESALATDALVLIGAPFEFVAAHRGRVVALASSSTSVNVAIMSDK